MPNNQNNQNITNPANQNITDWLQVYSLFEETAYAIIEANGGLDSEGNASGATNQRIAEEIEKLYAQHAGEEAWDIAHSKWYEWEDVSE